MLTGVALIVLFAAVPAAWIFFPRRRRALLPPSTFVQVLFRLLPLTGAIGLAISGGVLLLGSAGFALAQRLRRTP